MFTNRLFNLFVAIPLLVVVVLVAREGNATAAVLSNMDSATHSYTSWAKSIETSSMDSATRSYTAWAQAMDAGNAGRTFVPVTGNTTSSAVRSYTSWAKAVVCAANPSSDVALDSATRSYIAWAKAVEVGDLCH